MKKIIFIIAAMILIGGGVWLLFLAGQKQTLPPGNEIPLEEEAEEIFEADQELVEVLAKAQEINSLSYDVIATNFLGKFWQKEGKIRTEGGPESENGDFETVVLIDSQTGLAYAYLPALNSAIEISFSEAEEIFNQSIKEQASFILDYQPRVVGSEIIDGKDCLVIEYIAQGEDVKMWLWKDYGLPIRIEADEQARIDNISFADIPDSLFELPAGVEIMETPIF